MWLCLVRSPCFVKARWRLEAREGDEVANHVRLIAIPALQGEDRPIRHTASANQYQRALKSSDAAEQRRGDTDFLFEDRDQAALTQADQFRNLARPRRWPRRTESVGRHAPPDGVLPRETIGATATLPRVE